MLPEAGSRWAWHEFAGPDQDSPFVVLDHGGRGYVKIHFLLPVGIELPNGGDFLLSHREWVSAVADGQIFPAPGVTAAAAWPPEVGSVWVIPLVEWQTSEAVPVPVRVTDVVERAPEKARIPELGTHSVKLEPLIPWGAAPGVGGLSVGRPLWERAAVPYAREAGLKDQPWFRPEDYEPVRPDGLDDGDPWGSVELPDPGSEWLVDWNGMFRGDDLEQFGHPMPMRVRLVGDHGTVHMDYLLPVTEDQEHDFDPSLEEGEWYRGLAEGWIRHAAREPRFVDSEEPEDHGDVPLPEPGSTWAMGPPLRTNVVPFRVVRVTPPDPDNYELDRGRRYGLVYMEPLTPDPDFLGVYSGPSWQAYVANGSIFKPDRGARASDEPPEPGSLWMWNAVYSDDPTWGGPTENYPFRVEDVTRGWGDWAAIVTWLTPGGGRGMGYGDDWTTITGEDWRADRLDEIIQPYGWKEAAGTLDYGPGWKHVQEAPDYGPTWPPEVGSAWTITGPNGYARPFRVTEVGRDPGHGPFARVEDLIPMKQRTAPRWDSDRIWAGVWRVKHEHGQLTPYGTTASGPDASPYWPPEPGNYVWNGKPVVVTGIDPGDETQGARALIRPLLPDWSRKQYPADDMYRPGWIWEKVWDKYVDMGKLYKTAGSNDPIAYTYEADFHCPDCARAAFGEDEHGYPPEDARDSEGNPLGAVFPWDEWWQPDEPGMQSLYCGTCGATLDTVGEPDMTQFTPPPAGSIWAYGDGDHVLRVTGIQRETEPPLTPESEAAWVITTESLLPTGTQVTENVWDPTEWQSYVETGRLRELRTGSITDDPAIPEAGSTWVWRGAVGGLKPLRVVQADENGIFVEWLLPGKSPMIGPGASRFFSPYEWSQELYAGTLSRTGRTGASYLDQSTWPPEVGSMWAYVPPNNVGNRLPFQIESVTDPPEGASEGIKALLGPDPQPMVWPRYLLPAPHAPRGWDRDAWWWALAVGEVERAAKTAAGHPANGVPSIGSDWVLQLGGSSGPELLTVVALGSWAGFTYETDEDWAARAPEVEEGYDLDKMPTPSDVLVKFLTPSPPSRQQKEYREFPGDLLREHPDWVVLAWDTWVSLRNSWFLFPYEESKYHEGAYEGNLDGAPPVGSNWVYDDEGISEGATTQALRVREVEPDPAYGFQVGVDLLLPSASPAIWGHPDRMTEDWISGQDWLKWEDAGFLRTAALEGRDYEGERGNRNHITRVEEGTVPTSAVANLPGARGERPGEHRNRQGEAWQGFLDDVAQNGIRQPIFITVDLDTGPVISEGNHRRDAAAELGLPEVPVEVRYFGGAELDYPLTRTAADMDARRTPEPGELYTIQWPVTNAPPNDPRPMRVRGLHPMPYGTDVVLEYLIPSGVSYTSMNLRQWRELALQGMIQRYAAADLADADLFRCARCGREFVVDYSVRVGDDLFCETCARAVTEDFLPEPGTRWLLTVPRYLLPPGWIVQAPTADPDEAVYDYESVPVEVTGTHDSVPGFTSVRSVGLRPLLPTGPPSSFNPSNWYVSETRWAQWLDEGRLQAHGRTAGLPGYDRDDFSEDAWAAREGYPFPEPGSLWVSDTLGSEGQPSVPFRVEDVKRRSTTQGHVTLNDLTTDSRTQCPIDLWWRWRARGDVRPYEKTAGSGEDGWDLPEVGSEWVWEAAHPSSPAAGQPMALVVQDVWDEDNGWVSIGYRIVSPTRMREGRMYMTSWARHRALGEIVPIEEYRSREASSDYDPSHPFFEGAPEPGSLWLFDNKGFGRYDYKRFMPPVTRAYRVKDVTSSKLGPDPGWYVVLDDMLPGDQGPVSQPDWQDWEARGLLRPFAGMGATSSDDRRQLLDAATVELAFGSQGAEAVAPKYGLEPQELADYARLNSERLTGRILSNEEVWLQNHQDYDADRRTTAAEYYEGPCARCGRETTIEPGVYRGEFCEECQDDLADEDAARAYWRRPPSEGESYLFREDEFQEFRQVIQVLRVYENGDVSARPLLPGPMAMLPGPEGIRRIPMLSWGADLHDDLLREYDASADDGSGRTAALPEYASDVPEPEVGSLWAIPFGKAAWRVADVLKNRRGDWTGVQMEELLPIGAAGEPPTYYDRRLWEDYVYTGLIMPYEGGWPEEFDPENPYAHLRPIPEFTQRLRPESSERPEVWYLYGLSPNPYSRTVEEDGTVSMNDLVTGRPMFGFNRTNWDELVEAGVWRPWEGNEATAAAGPVDMGLWVEPPWHGFSGTMLWRVWRDDSSGESVYVLEDTVGRSKPEEWGPDAWEYLVGQGRLVPVEEWQRRGSAAPQVGSTWVWHGEVRDIPIRVERVEPDGGVYTLPLTREPNWLRPPSWTGYFDAADWRGLAESYDLEPRAASNWEPDGPAHPGEPGSLWIWHHGMGEDVHGRPSGDISGTGGNLPMRYLYDEYNPEGDLQHVFKPLTARPPGWTETIPWLADEFQREYARGDVFPYKTAEWVGEGPQEPYDVPQGSLWMEDQGGLIGKIPVKHEETFELSDGTRHHVFRRLIPPPAGWAEKTVFDDNALRRHVGEGWFRPYTSAADGGPEPGALYVYRSAFMGPGGEDGDMPLQVVQVWQDPIFPTRRWVQFRPLMPGPAIEELFQRDYDNGDGTYTVPKNVWDWNVGQERLRRQGAADPDHVPPELGSTWMQPGGYMPQKVVDVRDGQYTMQNLLPQNGQLQQQTYTPESWDYALATGSFEPHPKPEGWAPPASAWAELRGKAEAQGKRDGGWGPDNFDDAGASDYWLAMSLEGDPQLYDYVPSPFSGEYADSMNPYSFAEDLGLPDAYNNESAAEDLAEAYESAFLEAYMDKAYEMAKRMSEVPDVGSVWTMWEDEAYHDEEDGPFEPQRFRVDEIDARKGDLVVRYTDLSDGRQSDMGMSAWRQYVEDEELRPEALGPATSSAADPSEGELLFVDEKPCRVIDASDLDLTVQYLLPDGRLGPALDVETLDWPEWWRLCDAGMVRTAADDDWAAAGVVPPEVGSWWYMHNGDPGSLIQVLDLDDDDVYIQWLEPTGRKDDTVDVPLWIDSVTSDLIEPYERGHYAALLLPEPGSVWVWHSVTEGDVPLRVNRVEGGRAYFTRLLPDPWSAEHGGEDALPAVHWGYMVDHGRMERVSAAEDWGPMRMNEPTGDARFDMPEEVERRYVTAMQCPHCGSNLLRDAEGVHCPVCSWQPRQQALPFGQARTAGNPASIDWGEAGQDEVEAACLAYGIANLPEPGSVWTVDGQPLRVERVSPEFFTGHGPEITVTWLLPGGMANEFQNDLDAKWWGEVLAMEMLEKISKTAGVTAINLGTLDPDAHSGPGLYDPVSGQLWVGTRGGSAADLGEAVGAVAPNVSLPNMTPLEVLYEDTEAGRAGLYAPAGTPTGELLGIAQSAAEMGLTVFEGSPRADDEGGVTPPAVEALPPGVVPDREWEGGGLDQPDLGEQEQAVREMADVPFLQDWPEHDRPAVINDPRWSSVPPGAGL